MSVRKPRWCPNLQPGEGYVPFPFFLAYTSAVLKRDTDAKVILLDCPLEKLNRIDLINYTRAADLIVMESSAISRDLDLRTAEILKGENPRLKICFVGPHPSAMPDFYLKEWYVDYVITGEYELGVRDIVQGKVDIAKLSIGTFIEPLDQLPFPDRASIPQESYTTGFCREYPNIQIHSSRGCTFKCSFCLWPNTLYQNKFRIFSIEYVVNEMVHLKTKFPWVKEISFDDDNFTLRKDLVNLCKTIHEVFGDGMVWNCLGHTGTVNEEKIKWMAKSGCEKVAWGFEIYGANARKLMRKGVTPDQFERVLRWCKQYGIESHGTFMVGAPGETLKDAEATIDFIKYLQKEGLMQHAQKGMCVPFPGTPLYDEAKEKGWLVTDDLQKFDGTRQSVLNYPEFTKEEIEEVFRRMPVAGG